MTNEEYSEKKTIGSRPRRKTNYPSVERHKGDSVERKKPANYPSVERHDGDSVERRQTKPDYPSVERHTGDSVERKKIKKPNYPSVERPNDKIGLIDINRVTADPEMFQGTIENFNKKDSVAESNEEAYGIGFE